MGMKHSIYIILSYLVKNIIQRNMNRRGEKHVGAFIYQNNKRNESVTSASK